MTGLSDHSQDYLSRLRQRLSASAERKSRDPAALNTPEQHPALVAAALNHVFTIQTLPAQPEPPLVRQLFRDSVPAPGFWESRGRILSRPRRAEILRRLGLDGIRAALDGSAQPFRTPTQEMFETLVRAEPIALDTRSTADLVALREAAHWVAGLVDPPFSDSEIARAIDRSLAWSPFSHLLNRSFVGRDDDLGALGRFVGVEIADDGLKALRPSEQRLMLLEGVGGIGKSALIAHFLARIRNTKGESWCPFAYLPCDNPAADVTDTDLLLTEAAEQILRHVRVTRSPDSEDAVREAELAHKRFLDHVRVHAAAVDLASKRSSSSESLDLRLDVLRDGSLDVADAFLDFAHAATWVMAIGRKGAPPCLIVIDTFEEVRYRSAARLLPFWRLVWYLLDFSEHVRIIISGRPPVQNPGERSPAQRLPLTELSREASVDLLRDDVDLDPETLDRLARQIGGNPLNLRLAARVISGEAPARYGIKGLKTRHLGFFRVSEELIRGQLYSRVLDHIHDERVRKLAHPGMVVRRITPQVIETVLAPVCDIELTEVENAEHLFQELSKEHTLVRLDDDQSLRYRDDVRRPVLKLLTNDKPELTRQVHEAAFNHYLDLINESGAPDDVAACEAIYHGLMLGYDGAYVERFWVSGAGDGLDNAIDELPAEGKVWLAGKRDINLPEHYYQEASTAEWERIVGPRALALLQEVGSLEVLSMLSERDERTVLSPLVSIEARCLISIGDYAASEDLLTGALEKAPLDGNPGRKAEYLWLLAKTYHELGDRAATRDTLNDLAETAATLTSPLPLVQALSFVLFVAPVDDTSVPLFREDLARALERCSDQDISTEPDVVRRGFAHIDPAAAPRLPRVALTSLAGVYDIAEFADSFQPSPDGIRAILKLVYQSGNLGGRSKLGDGLVEALEANPLSTTSVRRAINVLRGPLVSASDRGGDADAVVAAQAAWHLVQMENSSLGTATLAGIDEYRLSWEVDTAFRAAAV